MSQVNLYMIRHGEKDLKLMGTDKQNNQVMLDAFGLSDDGQKRADALATVFGDEKYNIGHIISVLPKSDGNSLRPVLTILPLFQKLTKTNHDQTFLKLIDVDDFDDVVKQIKKAAKDIAPGKNILLCWEHHRLTSITYKLGVANAFPYPDDRFDMIWTIPLGTSNSSTGLSIESIDSEHAMPGDPKPGYETWKSVGNGWENCYSDGKATQTWTFTAGSKKDSPEGSKWVVTNPDPVYGDDGNEVPSTGSQTWTADSQNLFEDKLKKAGQ